MEALEPDENEDIVLIVVAEEAELLHKKRIALKIKLECDSSETLITIK